MDVKKHWLSGLVKCSSCGATLVYSQANAGFQCHKYARGNCKVSHYISARKLEQYVISSIEQVTITESFIQDITRVKKVDNVIDYGPQINKLENMLERAKRAYTEGIDTLEEYANNKKRISAELEAIKEKDAAQIIHTEFQSVDDVQQKFDSIITLLKSEVDDSVKNEAIAGIVDFIRFNRKESTVEIYFYL